MELEPFVRKIASVEYQINRDMFAKYGEVDPYVKGFLIKGGRLSAGSSIPVQGDFRDVAPAMVAKMLKQYTIVLTVCEVWSSHPGRSAGPDNRQEEVMIQLSSGSQTWIQLCPIQRSPNRLVEGELRLPVEMKGRAVSGSLRKSDAKTITRAIDKLMQMPSGELDDAWKMDLLMWFQRTTTELGDIAPVTDAVYEGDVDPARLAFATASLEAMTTVSSNTSASSDGTAGLEQYSLLGLNVRIEPPESGDDEDMVTLDETIEQIHRALGSAFDAAGLPVRLDPMGELVLIRPFFPLSLAHNLLMLGQMIWANRSHPSEASLREWMQEAFEKDGEEIAHDPAFHDGISLTIPLFVRTTPSSLANDFNARIQEPVRVLHEDVEEVVLALGKVATAAIEDLSKKVTGRLEPRFVGALYDALRDKHFESLEQRAKFIVGVADSGDYSSGAHGVVKAIVGAAFVAKPIKSEMVIVSFWDDQKFLAPFASQRLPYWTLLQYRDMIVTALQAAGIHKIQVLEGMPKLSEMPKDQFERPMLPGDDWTWFSPVSMTIPDAVGVLQTIGWESIKTDESQDPASNALPMPHMLQRFGVTSMMARRYTPPVYRAVKDALSLAQLSPDEAWALAGSNHQGLGRLLNDHPSLARPPDTLTLALQLAWSRAPTVRVTHGLIERLQYTDISDRLPAYLIGAPFPFLYMHLGTEARVAEIYAAGPESPAYIPTGAFVRQATVAEVRVVTFTLVWQTPDLPMEPASSEFRFRIPDQTATVSECMESALEGTEEEAMEPMRQALLLVIKALFYLGSRDARQVNVPERSQALKLVGKKTAEQQQKMLKAARPLYDHILVGPIAGLNLEPVEGLSVRQTKVFPRRGHLHGYWTGKGRSVYEVRLLDPIIVNRHLLDGQDEIPAPKSYLLH